MEILTVVIITLIYIRKLFELVAIILSGVLLGLLILVLTDFVKTSNNTNKEWWGNDR